MATTQYNWLLVSLVFFLVFRQSRLQSGDATSGDSGDWDDADENEMANPKMQSNKIPESNRSTTINSSDFTYTNHARDDHEVVVNVNRLMNKIPRATRKDCLRKCQRRHFECLHQLGRNVPKGLKICAVCITACRGVPQAGR